MPVRVVLAEDDVLLRAALAEQVARFGFSVCATAGDAPGLAAAVEEHRPDLVVTDIRMPPGFRDDGLRTAIALREAHPGLAVVVLSQCVEPDLAADLLDSHDGRGVGYLLEDRVADLGESSRRCVPRRAAARRVMAVLTFLRAESPTVRWNP